MSIRLKNLYKLLIENRKHEVQGWNKAYKNFYSKVEKIRERIKSGEGLSNHDESFLRELLYNLDNGIASRGQSVLSNQNFIDFIKNRQFLSDLESLIVNPNFETYQVFKKTWSDQGKSNNPVLINRVVAACTLDVSTTVDSGKFNQVFNWLMREKIIPIYPDSEAQDWFSKNQFLMKILKQVFSEEIQNQETDEFYLSQFVWELYENLSNPFSLKKQIIKYGAPGTGKTFQARQQTSLLFDIWKEEFAPDTDFTHQGQIELVQFHPSFSYEDFIEGLRPILDENGQAQLTLQNGIFKEFCLKAGKWEIDVFNLHLDKEWDEIKILDLHPYKDQLSNSYWDYIFRLEDQTKLVSNAIPPFFFIIDEINRAELSRVFGELMYCLEYRGVRGCVKTQYTNLNTNKTGMLELGQTYQFFIPTNIYLIGTMNTIDRSVESFDFALRRRFSWQEVSPDISLLKYYLSEHCAKWIELAISLEKLNEEIEKQALLGHEYQIGHAYLMNLKYPKSLSLTEVKASIWEDSIRPLLQEYLRGTGEEAELIRSFSKSFGV
ncbi:AAA family ATPase [Acinetobacter baumannii]|uniref:McrB family protein n=1 Tax=Acinetobacter TaxID=469 RepID=UPI0003556576|nr:AAA family ATPase [Acinetobacter baumannii]AGQ05241.1 GTPase subunit of restriction endonuclease [Acinetobacter baumannii BJAB0715]AMN00159.1 restriction endonuclease [Acinetobacter baumannii]MDB0263324.1 restriction endonuclease [Acinetobacter baumannii]MDB0307098.1 restriction endonuclease [Acinetobacter baumannii]MVO48341.1 AAA domain-containing protein [Acinetobacter baumannii]